MYNTYTISDQNSRYFAFVLSMLCMISSATHRHEKSMLVSYRQGKPNYRQRYLHRIHLQGLNLYERQAQD